MKISKEFGGETMKKERKDGMLFKYDVWFVIQFMLS